MGLNSYWDDRLNKSYGKLLKFLSKSPQKVAQVKEMQRNWVAFKENTLLTQKILLLGDEKTPEGGQWFEANYLSTIIDMTKNQCLFLEKLLETCTINNLT